MPPCDSFCPFSRLGPVPGLRVLAPVTCPGPFHRELCSITCLSRVYRLWILGHFAEGYLYLSHTLTECQLCAWCSLITWLATTYHLSLVYLLGT